MDYYKALRALLLAITFLITLTESAQAKNQTKCTRWRRMRGLCSSSRSSLTFDFSKQPLDFNFFDFNMNQLHQSLMNQQKKQNEELQERLRRQRLALGAPNQGSNLISGTTRKPTTRAATTKTPTTTTTKPTTTTVKPTTTTARRTTTTTRPTTTTAKPTTTTTKPTTTTKKPTTAKPTTTTQKATVTTATTSKPTTTTQNTNTTKTANSSTTVTPEVTTPEVTTPVPTAAEQKARDFIHKDAQMIPNMVQMAFHSCIGGCDGCINFDEPDNKGLIGSYNTVRLWCQRELSSLSLADCIYLTASQAVELGMDKTGEIKGANVPFTPGRKTCDDPDNYKKHFRFPQGHDLDGLDFLQGQFGLTRDEAVALMGAHSLGRAHTANSGFEGPWDFSETKLDNGFYKSLAGFNWKATNGTGKSTKYVNEQNELMMLYSDMAMLRKFTVDPETKQPSCIAARACPMSGDSNIVMRYQRDQQTWAVDFIRAFIKMINKKP